MEISILKSTEFLKDNCDFRIDAEYFSKSNLYYLKTLNKVGCKTIDEFSIVTDGIHTSIDYSDDSNVNLFSATTPRDNYFDLTRQVFISKKAHELNPRTALRENDIIISTVGTIGNCAVVNKTVLPANSDRHVGIIRLKNKDFYPRYLSTFLLSKYGRFQTFRESTGNVQLNLFLYRIRNLKIANLSKALQEKVENLILLNDEKRELSKQAYFAAETILLETLGLKDFELNKESINIKNFSESFLSTGRLDAEYYQKKYEKYTEIINSFLDGSIKIEQACIIADNNFLPMENQIYKYIELANIGKYGDISGYQFCKGSELPTRARRIVHEGDVIVSSIEGSLQSCAIITKEFDKALCSTGFYVIRSNFLNAETLLVLFKSDPIQYLLKQGCSGTILTAINRSEFNNIPIPLIDKTTQIKIADLVKNSFALKQQSEQLLNTAKLAVELAIEEGEEKGLEIIRKFESI